MNKNLVLLKIAVLSVLFSVAQVRNLESTKVNTSPKLDGSLDEPAWQNVQAATDFITNTPVFGKTPIVRSSVKVIYDNSAIYVGAYLYDQPGNVRKQMTVRDAEQRADVDYFAVFLDTYRDKQNAFQFLVTSRNVQTDARISPNFDPGYGTFGDVSWDAVWDSRVSIKPDGWVVEMKIPYSAIRFSKEDVQKWGVQFLRFTRVNNETSFWNPVDPNVNGFVNQFGELSGLNNLVPPLRLSFSPYVSGGYRGVPGVNGYKNEWLKSGGMDVKYGISESFTLDATLIPDFGQVISDNLINNLTPYELQFTENRPFFTEGTELFNKAGIFYSRRIGRTPALYDYVNSLEDLTPITGDSYRVIKNPEVTKLYNAIKFSGRTKHKLGIGVFNAITQPMHAKVRSVSTGKDSTILTEELTNYNIFVLDQAFKNRSYVTLTNTNVLRNGHARDANVTAVNLALYNKKNTYGFFLQPKYSKIFGPESYDGFTNFIEFGKVSGKFQYAISNNIESDKYDPNDLGILRAPNEVVNDARFSYSIYEPTRRLLNQFYNLKITQSYLYKPMVYDLTEIDASATVIFKNFWDLQFEFTTSPVWYNDYFELQTPENPRETPRTKLKRAPFYYGGISGSSDSRKRLFVRWNLGFAQGPLPSDPYHNLGLGARYRFSDRLTLDLFVERQHDNGQFGFSFQRDEMTGAPILARRKYTDFSSLFTGSYSFTPRMNMTLRARHYWNRILNTNFYDVKDDGYWTERFDRVPSDYDQNYNTFSLDVFYTWDFRLGSRIVVGWKNWLGRDYEYAINGRRSKYYPGNLAEVFNNPHGNEVTVRFIYYLDYLQLKRNNR